MLQFLNKGKVLSVKVKLFLDAKEEEKIQFNFRHSLCEILLSMLQKSQSNNKDITRPIFFLMARQQENSPKIP